MKRFLYYFYLFLAFISRCFHRNELYMKIIVIAFEKIGVEFKGKPTFIHYTATLDASGGLKICANTVISIDVLILTHDYSNLVGRFATSGYNDGGGIFDSVEIGDYSFLGAKAIVLPGTKIGHHCVIGSGAVVKGNIPDYSIVIGNPSKVIADTRVWGTKFCK